MRGALLACVLAVAVGSGAGCDAGESGTATADQPIINGAADTTHGAVVSLLNSVAGWTCSGTVIAVDGTTAVVLTAAHCAGADFVLTGDDSASPTGTYAVVDTRIHPDYDQSQFLDDFAMMRIADVPADLASIPCLTPAEDTLAIDTPLLVVGYGVTSTTDPSNTLRLHIRATINQLTTATITFSNAAGGSCSGDSGGPALTRGIERVAGVTSFGDVGCAVYSNDGRVSTVYDSFIAPYVTGVPAVDAAPPPDAAVGRDAGGNPDDGSGGGCDAGRRDPTGPFLLAAIVGAALALGGRRRARPEMRSGSS